MTVKSLGAHLAELAARKQTTQKSSPQDSQFSKTLTTAVQTQSATATSEQARVAVEMARLQMMRGALSLDEGGDERSPWTDVLASLTGLASSSATTVSASQNADSLPIAVKPPLAVAAVTTPAQLPTQAAIPGPVRVPQAVESIVDRASRRYGVDPALIKAVIKAESSFNQHAVSPVGAQGLMQLMPGTASDLGVKNPLDAEENVMGGTKYLKGLLKKYDGELDKALAAYNWGPGNVDRRGIETLPRETRDYLVKVKRFYDHYSA